MMSLELFETVKVGAKVKLIVKPTHVALAKNFSGEASFANKFKATVDSCEHGELLSAIKLSFFDTTLESILTLDCAKSMNLREGDSVTVFIQASELSIGEVYDA